jgi:hypothetical protein
MIMRWARNNNVRKTCPECTCKYTFTENEITKFCAYYNKRKATLLGDQQYYTIQDIIEKVGGSFSSHHAWADKRGVKRACELSKDVVSIQDLIVLGYDCDDWFGFTID